MMLRLSRTGLFAIFLCMASLAAVANVYVVTAHSVSRVPHGTVELIPEVPWIQPGSSFTAGLHFQLEPGWHIYWKNPGDSGLPPRLHWELPDGITAGPILWPTPKRLPIGSLLDYGYEGDVLLPVQFQAAETLPLSRNVNLRANLKVLVCRETCVPGKADVSLDLPVLNKSEASGRPAQGPFARALASLPLPQPASLETRAEETGNALTLTIKDADPNAAAEFFPDKNSEIQNAAPQKLEKTTGGLKLRLVKASDSQARISKLDGLLVLSDGGTKHAYEISANVVTSPTAAVSGASSSLILMVVLAFLGGIVLNLMPCVFPVLSIKALHLMEGAGKEYRAVRVGALAYTAGVLVSFWVLVAVLLILRASGAHLGWGFQLQSPPFVAFLCCLLFVFGLSLAGLFEIGGSMMSAGSGLAQRSGYTGSFFTGVLAVVVATPCTAPFMGAAVGFALSQPAWSCGLVFTAMALGLASPFLLLAFLPQLGRWVPKPGRWMETLKQFLAFPIFATVIWLLWVLGQQVDIDQLASVLLCLLAIAIGGWLLGRWHSNKIVLITATLIVVAAAAYPVSTLPASAVRARAPTATIAGSLSWEPFSAEKVTQYRSEKKPVLIDFTAAWCVTCQVNDRVVFHSSEVQKQLKDSHVALLRADWTSYDPNITQALAEFGRSAVPLYVLYLPDQEHPYVFPDGLLRPSSVISVLQKIKFSEASSARRSGV